MTTNTSFGFSVDTSFPYDEVDASVRSLLAAEGFGVLTEIDVRDTLGQKLGVDFPRYEILGACNPSLAYRALQLVPAIGLLLPCNVVLSERPDGGTRVAFMDPVSVLDLVDNPELWPVAVEARERLQRVAGAIEG